MLKKIAASVIALTMLFGSGVMPAVNVLPDTAVTASAEDTFTEENFEVSMIYTNAAGKEYEVKGKVCEDPFAKLGDDSSESGLAYPDDYVPPRSIYWEFDVNYDDLNKAMGGDLEGLGFSYKVTADPLSDENNYCILPCGLSEHELMVVKDSLTHKTELLYPQNPEYLRREGANLIGDSKRYSSHITEYDPEKIESIKCYYKITDKDHGDVLKYGWNYYHNAFENLENKITFSNAAGKSITFYSKCTEEDTRLTWKYDAIHFNDVKTALGDDLDGLQISVELSADALTKEYPEFIVNEPGLICKSSSVSAYEKETGKSILGVDSTMKEGLMDSFSLSLDGSKYKKTFIVDTFVDNLNYILESIDKDTDYKIDDCDIVFDFEFYLFSERISPKVDDDDSSSSKTDDSSSKGDSDTSSKTDDSSSKPDDSSSKPDTKPTKVLGNINGDDKIDIGDVTMLINHVNGVKALSPEELKSADVNGDGKVDIGDAAAIINHINGVKALF